MNPDQDHMSAEAKKQILAVVLNTGDINIDDAKNNYINQLNTLINVLNDLNRTDDNGTQISDAKYLRAIKSAIARYTPKFQLFDYESALGELQQQNILITKKELSKFINLK